MTQPYICLHLNRYLHLGHCILEEEIFFNALNDIKKRYPQSTILLFDIFELTSYVKPERFSLFLKIQDIMESSGHPYYFVLDKTINTHLSDYQNVIHLNWNVASTYYFTTIWGNPTLAKTNSNHNKGLFLIGKGEKLHRIGLLKLFYETNNLDKILWSFKSSESSLKIMKDNFFKDYTDEHYQDFLKICINDIDSMLDSSCVQEGFPFGGIGFPYDVSIYEQTGFSVISETWVNYDHAFVSEKTWRAVANSHPFVLVGPVNNFNWLNQNGFETFTRFFPISNYYEFTNNQEFLLECVVANTLFMNRELKTSMNFYKELARLSRENKIRFYQMAKDEITTFLNKLNVGKEFLSVLINFHNEIQLYDQNRDYN